jgi:hypothetical protein
MSQNTCNEAVKPVKRGRGRPKKIVKVAEPVVDEKIVEEVKVEDKDVQTIDPLASVKRRIIRRIGAKNNTSV